MLRLIFATTDAGRAANCGGPVIVEHKTFDVDLPDVEQWLSEPKTQQWSYIDRCFVGLEVLEGK